MSASNVDLPLDPGLGRTLIYGANGYTGDLLARAAAARGLRPILAARNAAAVHALASALGLEARVFGLDDAAAIDAGLSGVRTVLNCAGPFSRTSRPMSDGCFRARAHYLDVTGEVTVFESLAARDAQARQAGIVLLPGVGFDVVPSDCLAAHLKRRLPTASRLALAFQQLGGVSRGTATTMLENAHRGGLIRRDGVLTPVPAAWRSREIDFGNGPRTAVTIPWGDVSTAYHSTGIPSVEVYVAVPRPMRVAVRLLRVLGPLVGTGPVQSFLKRRIRSGPAGPSAEERFRSRSRLWGEVTDDQGGRAVSRLQGPDGYTLTVFTALASAQRLAQAPVPPGFQTPSRAFGPDFILEMEGVSREDL